MTKLARSEENRYLYLITAGQEFLGLAESIVNVMWIDFRTQTHLADFTSLLVFPSLSLPLRLLIFPLPIVQKTRNRRVGLRCHLNEVGHPFFREPQGLRQGHDAQLCSLFIDDPHFSSTDLLIDALFLSDALYPPSENKNYL